MKKQEFRFELPDELIAQYPLDARSDSRLLTYCRQTGNIAHRLFQDLADYLEPNDLLVMNDTQVIPARFYGKKQSGGKVEFLVERVLTDRTFLAHIKASKAPKAGCLVDLDKGFCVEITGRDDDLFFCKTTSDVDTMLHDIGHIPLPLYITRHDESMDVNRYQTVYAKHKGSVAAPTAGLHFDEKVFRRLEARGVRIAYVTLHVGAGTFRPVRSDDIREHKMHKEFFVVSEALSDAIRQTRDKGGRVIAVGTTALRSLESAAIDGTLKPCSRETDIFITPGYEFKVCDGLITNFHLPESTLLMLVSAFIGHKEAMGLYQLAIEHRYRFYSYGDASLLL